MRFFFFLSSNLCFAAIMSHDSGKSIAEDDTKLADLKSIFGGHDEWDEACDEDGDGAGSRTDRSNGE